MTSGRRARQGNEVGRIAAIVDAVSQAEITEFDVWHDLDVPSRLIRPVSR